MTPPQNRASLARFIQARKWLRTSTASKRTKMVSASLIICGLLSTYYSYLQRCSREFQVAAI
jgi:hypothetical protein